MHYGALCTSYSCTMEEFIHICKVHITLDEINDAVIDAKINIDRALELCPSHLIINVIKILLSKIKVKQHFERDVTETMTIKKILEWCGYLDFVCIIKSLLSGVTDTKYARTLFLLNTYAPYLSRNTRVSTKFKLERAIVTGDIETVRKLINKNNWQCTEDVINLAVRQYQNDMLRLFIDLHKTRNAHIQKDRILVAIECENCEATQLLLNHSDATKIDYKTCILAAIRTENITIVKILEQSGGNPAHSLMNSRKQSKRNPTHSLMDSIEQTRHNPTYSLMDSREFILAAAQGSNNEIIFMFLTEFGINSELLIELIKSNNLSMIQEIAHRYPRVFKKILTHNNAQKLLHHAIRNVQPAIFSLFIERVDTVSADIMCQLISGGCIDALNVVLQKFPNCIRAALSTMDDCEIKYFMKAILSQTNINIVPILLKHGLKIKPYLLILFIKFGHCELLAQCPFRNKIIRACANYASFDNATLRVAKGCDMPMLNLLLDCDVQISTNTIAALVDTNNVSIIERMLQKFPNTIINVLIATAIVHHNNPDIVSLFVSSNGNNYRELLCAAILNDNIGAVETLLGMCKRVDEDIFLSDAFMKRIEIYFPSGSNLHAEHGGKDSGRGSGGDSDSDSDRDRDRDRDSALFYESADECDIICLKQARREAKMFANKNAKHETYSSQVNAQESSMTRTHESVIVESDMTCCDNEDIIFEQMMGSWTDDCERTRVRAKVFRLKKRGPNPLTKEERKWIFVRIIRLLLNRGANVAHLPHHFLARFSKYVSSEKKEFAEMLLSSLHKEDRNRMLCE